MDIVDYISSPLCKRTVNVSSVTLVLNWASPVCGPRAACSSVTLPPALWILFLVLVLSLAVVVSSEIDYNAAVQYHWLLSLALLPLTDAKLSKSNEFNVIRNFRLLHTRCLCRKQNSPLYSLLYSPDLDMFSKQYLWLQWDGMCHFKLYNMHYVLLYSNLKVVLPYQFKGHIFVTVRIVNNLLQICSN